MSGLSCPAGIGEKIVPGSVKMTAKKFNQPHIAINRVYTRNGDSGTTSLAGGKRIDKDSQRVEAYGTIDELNTFLGAALQSAQKAVQKNRKIAILIKVLLRIQQELFNLGGMLASVDAPREGEPAISGNEIEQLEKEIDWFNGHLTPLPSFVLPGGSRLSAELQICRTVCRRAERICVRLNCVEPLAPEILSYLNRLGDAFFTWSRWANLILKIPESLWDPNQASSAQNGNS
jgi:cob(I)alamin adenosyltransferase